MTVSTTVPTTFTHRTLLASADTSLLRYQSYNGVDHLVVPVIPLVGDVVVYPSNGLGAEFVPSTVLSQVPTAWNGRPVVYNHPSTSDGSANDPSILDLSCMGQMFNTTFDSGKLKSEAWIDVPKCDQVGANSLLEKFKSGELVEVSVGAFIALKKQAGVHNGQKYDYIWLNVIPDHLAMLEIGEVGACSNEMGCGAPRLMNGLDGSNEGGIDVPELESGEKVNQLPSSSPSSETNRFMRGLQRAFSWAFRSNELSDVDLRWQLEDLLRNVEPGFEWIERIYSESTRVVYSCYTEKQTHFYQRTYTVTSDVAQLNDDRVEGQWVTEFKPLDAESEAVTSGVVQASSCTCHSNLNKETIPVANPIVDRLITKKLLAEKDRAKIEALDQAHIVALAASLEGDKKDKGVGDTSNTTGGPTSDGSEIPPPTGEPKTPGAVGEQTNTAVQPANTSQTQTPTGNDPARALSGAQLLASLPADDPIRKLVARAEAEEKARRVNLISHLSKAQTHIKADQLEKKSTDQLEELAGALGVSSVVGVTTFDYSGQGIGNSTSTSQLASHKRPNAWGIRKEVN